MSNEHVDLNKIEKTGEKKSYTERSLSEILILAQINRPDEWSMQDYARMAYRLELKLEKANKVLYEIEKAPLKKNMWGLAFQYNMEENNPKP